MVSLQPSRSFWLTDLEASLWPVPQDLPQTTDAVVIGGGLTGSSTAYWLSTLGVRTALLERGHMACGATGRNGGHIVLGLNQDFATSTEFIGTEETLALWAFTQQSTELVRQFVTTHDIDCDLLFNQWVTLALTADQAATLRANYQLMAAYDLAVTIWDETQVTQRTHSDCFKGALVEPVHAQLWPAKLVLGIARVAAQQGSIICPATTVLEVRREQNGFIVKCDRGEIRAQAVVYATNAYTHHLLPDLRNVIIPVRGQVIATEPIPRLWDFDWMTYGGYEYAVQRQDGRVIFGGMRRKSPTQEIGLEDDSTLEPRVGQSLRQFLQDTFEPIKTAAIDYEWTGIMAYTSDENPLIGELAHRPGEYIAAGYTGHGMCFGFLAGKALAERIASKNATPLPSALDPNRFFHSNFAVGIPDH